MYCLLVKSGFVCPATLSSRFARLQMIPI
jgi:hypothetical protein